MLANQTPNVNLTKIQISQVPLYHQKQILSLLRNSLGRFAGIYRSTIEPEKIPSKEEDYLTSQISRFLNKEIDGYLFEPQSQCGPDLQVIIFKTFRLHEPPIIVIEAKRLRSKSGADYVKGKTGGIERFKRQNHASTLSIAVMLGYVEEKEFSYWHKKLNSWIDVLINGKENDIVWEERDKLTKVAISEIAEYKSIHCRTQEEPITLHHFWINLCNHAPKITNN